ncbi:MAG: ABC transporter ATP-binding protein [Armatimonadetes bacterium]|nr:ABC transporter ATP-binding protein [Armatimonadota bacterium]
MPADHSPIQLEHVTYRVGDTAVLDGIDLAVQKGEILGVMGRSGTGKTTLLRLIIGLIRPTSGRVLVYDQDVSGFGEAELDAIRRSIGMVFQGAALFDSMTVAENVAFPLIEHHLLPRPDIGGRVAELLAMVGMENTGDLLPSQLSGGMRKRVGVARALAQSPTVFLYDEPTAGLDPISAAAVDDLIVRLRDEVGVTSIIVSHDVESLRRVTDRAAVLHEGRFLAVGPLKQLEHSDDLAVRQFLSGSLEGPLTAETQPFTGG